MDLYAAREKNNEIFLWPIKPSKSMSCWCVLGQIVKTIRLDPNDLPEVKWEDEEPTKVKLTIC